MKKKTETNFLESQISGISYSQMQQVLRAEFARTVQDPKAPQPLSLQRKAAHVQACRLYHGEGI